MNLFYLIIGLTGLWLGSEIAIKGALNISKRFNISSFFIGLTLLALLTDLPEIFVHITGAIDRLGGMETSGVVVGETLGTSFGQIALALGVLGIFKTLYYKKCTFNTDMIFLIGSSVLVFILSLGGYLSRIDGILLVIAYFIYLYFIYKRERSNPKIRSHPKIRLEWAILSIIAGLGILLYCSNLTINNAVILAQKWAINPTLIGVLIIGPGTSLPELAISISAIVKGENDLAVGNLVGSTILDLLFALGVGSAISGFLVDQNLISFDIPFLIITCFIVYLFFRKDYKIKPKESWVFLVIYLAYITVKLIFN